MVEFGDSGVNVILSAPLVSLTVASQITDSVIPLCEGLDLVRSPLIKMDDRQVAWFGDQDLDTIRSAEWGLRLTFVGDANIHLGEREKQAEATINFASAALWIAKPMCAGIPYLLLYRDDSVDGTPHSVTRSTTSLKPLAEHGDSELENGDIETLKVIVPRILEMRGDNNAIMRAIRYQVAALHSWHVFPRIAMMTAALESLFTTDNTEVSHKVSERVAFLLEHDAETRRALFRQVKAIYGLRSSVVHGSGLGKKSLESVRSDCVTLEALVSRCLRAVLLSEDLLNKFSGSQDTREGFLGDLMFPKSDVHSS